MKAKHLRIEILKNNIKTIDLFLPARSVQWIIELMPEDVLQKIQLANIDLNKIQEKYLGREICQGEVFSFNSIEKKIRVWLE
jgi:hypothetical protein